ncbi:MAG: hypothetical protein A4E32_01801 [Methanomassiliicoccales archaeon PtaU1.Bin124]|nr:MAG: hypothetical protein A4E32_01801 [Methanomassiliicoccales archaeon PtaU1.Bin124]
MLPPPRWFIPLDTTVQLFTGIVALAVALYALRGYRWVKEPSLNNIFMAFLLLAVAFLVDALTMSTAYLEGIPFDQTFDHGTFIQLGFAVYYGFSIVAYGLLLYTYCRRYSVMAAAPMAPFVMFNSPPLEIIIIGLLAAIVIAQVLRERTPGRGVQGLVSLSFLLVLVSHVLILFESADYLLYFSAKGMQMVGFALMGFVLYRLGRMA